MLDGFEACFTFHDGIGHAYIKPQGGEEDDEPDGVDVMGDDGERGFLGFDEGDDAVEAEFDDSEEGLLGALLTTTVSKRLSERMTKEEREWTDLCILLLLLSSRHSGSSQTGLLLLLRLGAVLIQQVEHLHSTILYQRV